MEDKISLKEYEDAYKIVKRFEYQQNPTISVSVTYLGTIDCHVRVPADWDIERIKDELKDGVPLHLIKDDVNNTNYGKILELIVDGDDIKIK